MKKQESRQTTFGMVTAEELTQAKKIVATTQLFIDGALDIESSIPKKVARGHKRVLKAIAQMKASGNDSLIESARRAREKHGLAGPQ